MGNVPRVINYEVNGQMVANYDCEFPELLARSFMKAMYAEWSGSQTYRFIVEDYFDCKKDDKGWLHFTFDVTNDANIEPKSKSLVPEGDSMSFYYDLLIYPEETGEVRIIKCCTKVKIGTSDSSSDTLSLIYDKFSECYRKVADAYDDIVVTSICVDLEDPK
jgi:hypothetical protein